MANLVYNRGLELASPVPGSNGGSSPTMVTDRAFDGIRSSYDPVSKSSGGTAMPVLNADGSYARVVPGTRISASVSVFCLQAIGCVIGVRWGRSDNSLLSESTSAAQAIPGGAWTTVSTSNLLVPTSAATATIKVRQNGSTGVGVWTDAYVFNVGPVAESYLSIRTSDFFAVL